MVLFVDLRLLPWILVKSLMTHTYIGASGKNCVTAVTLSGFVAECNRLSVPNVW